MHCMGLRVRRDTHSRRIRTEHKAQQFVQHEQIRCTEDYNSISE